MLNKNDKTYPNVTENYQNWIEIEQLFPHEYILHNKLIVAVHNFVYMLIFIKLICSHSSMMYMHSQLPSLSLVKADIVFEQGNINNFISQFFNV